MKNKPVFATSNETSHQEGMSIREYYAIRILQSYILDGERQDHDVICVDAVWMADKLIAELEK